MRTDRHVTMLALALALLAGACGTPREKTATLPDDLKQDLAAAAASSGDLAAPQSFQPMRFVSNVERSRAAKPAKRVAMAHHHTKAAPTRRPAPEVASEAAPDPMDAMVAEAPTPVSTPEAPTPEPTVIAHQPTTAPSGSGGEVGGGERGQGSGWGGILGGIGIAVIRGGIGGVDKCDPRTDGHPRMPVIIDRPDFRTPIPMGQPTFPRARRR